MQSSSVFTICDKMFRETYHRQSSPNLISDCSLWWSLTKKWWVVESRKHCSSWWCPLLVLQRTLGSPLSVSEEPYLRARGMRGDYSCSSVIAHENLFTRNRGRWLKIQIELRWRHAHHNLLEHFKSCNNFPQNSIYIFNIANY